MGKPKVKCLLWDIESTNLNASFGTILCIGYKWLGDKRVHVPTILDYSRGQSMLDDKGLVCEFAKVFETADYHVAHYGGKGRFDLPMLQSKLLKHKQKPLPPLPMIDTWAVARKELRMHSNRLKALAGFLQVPHQKTDIDFDAWMQAAHGNRAALREVKNHCRLDVLVLEEVFQRLRPLIPIIPNRQLYTKEHLTGCPDCGSLHIQRRGPHVGRTRLYQRYQCQACGKWFRDRTCVKGSSAPFVGI